jgi:hypothetical protein
MELSDHIYYFLERGIAHIIIILYGGFYELL